MFLCHLVSAAWHIVFCEADPSSPGKRNCTQRLSCWDYYLLLNGLMTNSHLLMTVPKGQWALAGFDLTALAAVLLLGWTARRVGKAAREISNSQTGLIIVSDEESEQI